MARDGRSVDFLFEHYSFVYISNDLCRSSRFSKLTDGENVVIAKHAHTLICGFC